MPPPSSLEMRIIVPKNDRPYEQGEKTIPYVLLLRGGARGEGKKKKRGKHAAQPNELSRQNTSAPSYFAESTVRRVLRTSRGKVTTVLAIPAAAPARDATGGTGNLDSS